MSEEVCDSIDGDNRFEVIEAAKADIIKRTNIESRKEDMAALDSMLFRSWQMGWLDKYDPTKPKSDDAVKMRKALEAVKDAIETDVLYAPGRSPSYESMERVRKVYQKVLVALGKGDTSNDNKSNNTKQGDNTMKDSTVNNSVLDKSEVENLRNIILARKYALERFLETAVVGRDMSVSTMILLERELGVLKDLNDVLIVTYEKVVDKEVHDDNKSGSICEITYADGEVERIPCDYAYVDEPVSGKEARLIIIKKEGEVTRSISMIKNWDLRLEACDRQPYTINKMVSTTTQTTTEARSECK